MNVENKYSWNKQFKKETGKRKRASESLELEYNLVSSLLSNTSSTEQDHYLAENITRDSNCLKVYIRSRANLFISTGQFLYHLVHLITVQLIEIPLKDVITTFSSRSTAFYGNLPDSSPSSNPSFIQFHTFQSITAIENRIKQKKHAKGSNPTEQYHNEPRRMNVL